MPSLAAACFACFAPRVVEDDTSSSALPPSARAHPAQHTGKHMHSMHAGLAANPPMPAQEIRAPHALWLIGNASVEASTAARSHQSSDWYSPYVDGACTLQTGTSRFSVDSHACNSYAAVPRMSWEVHGFDQARCAATTEKLPPAVSVSAYPSEQQLHISGQQSSRQLFALLSSSPTAYADPSSTTTTLTTSREPSSHLAVSPPAWSRAATGADASAQLQQQHLHAGELLHGDTPSDAARRLLTRHRSRHSSDYKTASTGLSVSPSCSSVHLQPTYAGHCSISDQGIAYSAPLLPASPRHVAKTLSMLQKHDGEGVI